MAEKGALLDEEVGVSKVVEVYKAPATSDEGEMNKIVAKREEGEKEEEEEKKGSSTL